MGGSGGARSDRSAPYDDQEQKTPQDEVEYVDHDGHLDLQVLGIVPPPTCFLKGLRGSKIFVAPDAQHGHWCGADLAHAWRGFEKLIQVFTQFGQTCRHLRQRGSGQHSGRGQRGGRGALTMCRDAR